MMATDLPDEELVYQHCKDIINGEKAQLVLEKTIISHLKSHRSFIKPLNDCFSTIKIAKVVERLLRENVFDSQTVARDRFPRLFHNKLAQSLATDASEIDASDVESVDASETILTPNEDENNGADSVDECSDLEKDTRQQEDNISNITVTEYVYRYTNQLKSSA